MKRRKLYVGITAAGFFILLVCVIAFATPQTAKAQCGSQASSCKNCHEVQAKDPVNADGTGWHQSHAFGDFCYICHGGNNQATDKDAAHTSMVKPLSDVQAACAQCHPNDLQARADVYAKALGVTVGTGASAPASGSASSATATPAAAAALAAPAAPAAAVPVVDKASLVNYTQRYDQEVLGKTQINWGNIILLVMIAAMLVGGGGLVLTREHLVRVTFKDTMPVTGEYSEDVVNMVPDLARLKPEARQSLRRLLQKPAAGDLLDAVDKLTTHESEE
jgi:hypothetical protein